MLKQISPGDRYRHKEQGTLVEVRKETSLGGEDGYTVHVFGEQRLMFLTEDKLDDWERAEEYD